MGLIAITFGVLLSILGGVIFALAEKKSWTALFIGPRSKKSTNAAIEVATPVIVRTGLGTSSM